MTEWSELPRDLLYEILTHLNSPIDTLRFRSVCSKWRQSPPSNSNSNSHQNALSLHSHGISLCKRSILFLSPPHTFNLELPSNLNSWVIKIEEKTPQNFNFFFPFSWTRITPLPTHFPRFMDISNIRIRELGCEYFLRYADNACYMGDFLKLLMETVAFLPRKNGDDFFLLTIHVCGRLALFNNVDDQWHLISDDVDLPYDDVIAFNGDFYAVDITGRTVCVRVDSVDNSVILVAKAVCGGDKKRLVEIGGELMLVDVYRGLPPLEDGDCVEEDYVSARSLFFKVYRLNREGKNWVEVKGLGNYILFLGMYSAFSASAVDLLCHKGDCIHFAFPENLYPSHINEDEDVFKFHCGGVFNLEDGSITYSKLFWPPPSWITSSL